MKVSTFTSTLYKIPTSLLTNLSAIINLILVGLGTPKPNLSYGKRHYINDGS